jgi:recombination associated protein RdgC
MWFKNLQMYRFTRPFEFSAEELGEALATRPFEPCGNLEPMRAGWVAPLGHPFPELVHSTNGYLMICARRQEKVLPAAVVNEALEEQIQAIELAEMRKVGRKERTKLKDELVFTLMPRALARSTLLYAYIDPAEGLLVVNAASANKAEELLDWLREALGSLPVIPMRPKGLPLQVMTAWLLDGAPPAGFQFGHECELRDPADEGAVIRCQHQDLVATEINSHMKLGLTVTRLGLSWQGGIECLVDENMAVKRLAFDDVIQERAGEDGAEDAAAQFDADFAIMSMELSRFISALMQAFGGEDLSEVDQDKDEAAVVADTESVREADPA